MFCFDLRILKDIFSAENQNQWDLKQNQWGKLKWIEVIYLHKKED